MCLVNKKKKMRILFEQIPLFPNASLFKIYLYVLHDNLPQRVKFKHSDSQIFVGCFFMKDKQHNTIYLCGRFGKCRYVWGRNIGQV